MNRFVGSIVAAFLVTIPALAEETPRHAIAVAGESELLLPPDYATITVGVVTQAPLVRNALAENSERMTHVIAAIKSLGVLDKDLQTSTFRIRPKYEKAAPGDYSEEAFRTIVGYSVSNEVTVTTKDLTNVAKTIDESVAAGANTSGEVIFRVNNLSAHLDDARRNAIENARHKAQVLTEASALKLGPAVSITDNEANTSYNSRASNEVETVVVTAERRATPIEPGLVTIHSTVTIVYSVK